MNREDLIAASSANVVAFLHVIRAGETSQDDSAYRMMFGGGLFDAPPWAHPRQAVTRNGLTSTAAGAYQFLEGTWDQLARDFGLVDFSPNNQDLAAIALLAQHGAIQALQGGDLAAAIALCNKTWASLPGSPYGQPTRSLEDCAAVFVQYGGQLAGGPPPPPQDSPDAGSAPANDVPEDQPQGESTMGIAAAILSALGPQIVQMIPALGQLFGSGSDVQKRNVAALTMVADTITKTAGAPNVQAAVEKMQADPSVLADVKSAVHELLPQIMEAGGGGIAGARKASSATDGLPFWKQGAFYVTLLLLLMPFMLLVDAFFVHPSNYDGNLRTQIVTAVLLIISAAAAFWLGSSFGSQKKDSALANAASASQ